MSKPPSKTTLAKGPLRKIVGSDWLPCNVAPGGFANHHGDLLECGHIISMAQDIFGHCNRERRRCRKCRDGLPPDPRKKDS